MSLKGRQGKSFVKKTFLVYVVLIMLLAIVPFGNTVRLDEILLLNFRADHLIHVALFIPWAFFCIKMDKNLLLWFLWGIFFALVSEGVQYLLPYRSFNVSDMLANGIGLAVGFIIFVPLFKLAVKSEE